MEIEALKKMAFDKRGFAVSEIPYPPGTKRPRTADSWSKNRIRVIAISSCFRPFRCFKSKNVFLKYIRGNQFAKSIWVTQFSTISRTFLERELSRGSLRSSTGLQIHIMLDPGEIGPWTGSSTQNHFLIKNNAYRCACVAFSYSPP